MSETASSPTILLVDDEAPITATLAPYLERNGFAVVIAGDGEEALHVLRQRPVDIIVSDVLMPRRDGRSLVRELRAREDCVEEESNYILSKMTDDSARLLLASMVEKTDVSDEEKAQLQALIAKLSGEPKREA